MCKVISLHLQSAVRFSILIFCIGQIFCQEPTPQPSPPPPPASNVQFVNAVSVELVDLSVNGFRDYPGLVQASRISGGVFPMLDWSVKLKPSGPIGAKTEISTKFKLGNTSSSTIVLVGDFQLVKDSSGKEKPRAAIVNISNDFKPREAPNRLCVVNGCPADTVTISVPGQTPQVIEPMEQYTWNSLPSSLTAVVNVKGKAISLPMEFVSPFTGVVVALFNRGVEPDYVLMPQASMHDLK